MIGLGKSDRPFDVYLGKFDGEWGLNPSYKSKILSNSKS